MGLDVRSGCCLGYDGVYYTEGFCIGYILDVRHIICMNEYMYIVCVENYLCVCVCGKSKQQVMRIEEVYIWLMVMVWVVQKPPYIIYNQIE